MSLDIYKNKTVFITGNTGFKGSWLSTWLIKLGAKVIGYSLDIPTEPSMFKILKLEDKIRNIYGDIIDEKRLVNMLDFYQPEIIFHLAAQPIVKRSYREPKLTFETNVMGTLNVLEAIRKIESVKVAVMITTDKVYKDKYPHVYSEFHPLGGNDPYSSSKACAELVINSYRNSFLSPKVNVASTRAGNIIGGGDWAKRLVPVCIEKILHEEKIPLYAPNAVRPWQYILEPLYGYLLLGAKMYSSNKFNEAWNFGPPLENCITVEELTKKIIRNWGIGSYEIIEPNRSMPESQHLRLDCRKAINNLGWTPKYNIEKMIEKTVSWYKEFYNNNSNMYKYTVNEIEEYERCLN